MTIEIKNTKLTENVKVGNISKACLLSLSMLFSSNSDASWISDHVKIDYDADYYERYNQNNPKLENSSSNSGFSINSGYLYADGQKLELVGAENINLSKEQLKDFGIEEYAVKINGNFFRVEPSFKQFSFQKTVPKYGLGYKIGRDIILVYSEINGKITVFGSISQGQYIEEDQFKEYSISNFQSNKKQILNRTLQLLGADSIDGRDIKLDGNDNNYFYYNGKLMGVLQNFGNEKILIKGENANGQVIARLMISNGNFLMTDPYGKVLYQNNGNSNIDIDLNVLGYTLNLNVNN